MAISGLTPGNVKVDAMRAFWDTPGTEVDLGVTVEGSILTIEQGVEEHRSPLFGDMPYDGVYNGERVTVRLLLAESRNDLLLILLQGSTETAGPTRKSWRVGSLPGRKFRTGAKQLRLHPIKTINTADDSDNIFIWIAAPRFVSEPITLDNGRRVYVCDFLALPDLSKGDGEMLMAWKTDAT